MTETAGMSPEEAAAARVAEQARIRKERREAKIKAGGSARLNRITGLGGGVQRDPVPSAPASSSTSSSPAPTPAADVQAPTEQHHADPDEVDISQHYYKPETSNRIPTPSQNDPANMSDDQLRQMMLGFDRPTNGRMPSNPFFDPSSMMGSSGDGPDAEDPMMKMLQQMLGGGAAGGSGPAAESNSNPFAQFAAMSGAGAAQQQQQQQQPQATAAGDSYAVLWRLLHFTLAMGLGLYISLFASTTTSSSSSSSFTGTKIERERGAVAFATSASGAAAADEVADLQKYFFWAFATAETILLTSRFFLDRGRAPPPGMLWTVLGFLPEGKWKGYLVMGLRYSQIFSTVRMDILLCVFVLGMSAWLRS